MDVPINPFTPTFGIVPPIMAGRTYLIDDVVRALDRGPGDPNLATIYVGARGTGKTALLSYLSSEAQRHGWISVGVAAALECWKTFTSKRVKLRLNISIAA